MLDNVDHNSRVLASQKHVQKNAQKVLTLCWEIYADISEFWATISAHF